MRCLRLSIPNSLLSHVSCRSLRVTTRVPLLTTRSLANVQNSTGISEYAIRSSTANSIHDDAPPPPNNQPPDDRKLKLGKTIRILHERLPNLLASPLPQDILSPNIVLRLFPSTHPHLPSVSGRIGYTAALWTSPMAWGRMPVLGNIKLIILSERMLRTGSGGKRADNNEKLVVRWKTCGKNKVTQDGKQETEFVGLFIFEFDDQGRISMHTIEHVEEGNNWEKKTPGFISVTDWLLRKARGGNREDEVPGLAFCEWIDREEKR
jgi:hypothetical protein